MNDIANVARLITEDPDVFASGQHQDLLAKASKLGGNDPASTTQVRKQMEKQKDLQRQDRMAQQKKLDPFFQELEDTEDELGALDKTMQQQQQDRQETLGLFGNKLPKIDKAVQGIRNNIPK